MLIFEIHIEKKIDVGSPLTLKAIKFLIHKVSHLFIVPIKLFMSRQYVNMCKHVQYIRSQCPDSQGTRYNRLRFCDFLAAKFAHVNTT